ncbi:MAG TPA: CPBP family intramembrane glutamic endopeptidase [Parasegetibacter sp.]
MRYLKYQSPASQFFALMGIFCGLLLVGSLTIAVIFNDLPGLLSDDATEITGNQLTQFKLMQLLNTFIAFILPAFIFNYLSDEAPFQYAGFRRNTNLVFIGLTLVILLASLPLVGTLGNWNEQIHFGSFQESLKRMEATYEKAMEMMLQMNSTGELIVNFLLLAVLPGFAEEYFFRGTLQQVLMRWWKKPAIAILVTSLLFALLHGTVFKVLPIFSMGILLGILFHVTKNLWYNILFHSLFNGIQIVILYLSKKQVIRNFDPITEEMSFPVWMAAVGLLIIILCLFYMERQKGWMKRDT